MKMNYYLDMIDKEISRCQEQRKVWEKQKKRVIDEIIRKSEPIKFARLTRERHDIYKLLSTNPRKDVCIALKKSLPSLEVQFEQLADSKYIEIETNTEIIKYMKHLLQLHLQLQRLRTDKQSTLDKNTPLVRDQSREFFDGKSNSTTATKNRQLKKPFLFHIHINPQNYSWEGCRTVNFVPAKYTGDLYIRSYDTNMPWIPYCDAMGRIEVPRNYDLRLVLKVHAMEIQGLKEGDLQSLHMADEETKTQQMSYIGHLKSIKVTYGATPY